MKMRSIIFILCLTFGMVACKSQSLSKRKQMEKAREQARLDSLDAIADWEGEEELDEIDNKESGPYRASNSRSFDLMHTKLDVRFNWEKAQMPGKAWLTLKPYFYPASILILDAKGFDIQKVALISAAGMSDLKYVYDLRKLSITLDKEYKRGEEIKIYIEYTAKPEELPEGGSAAISSDKGLYFINYDGSDPNKPKQIWTQGETEAASCWFPTLDSPNERCTEEISITVEDKYVTLSNGSMTASQKNPDGTRTDTWKMDLPHAPYLFMMAIGEFSIVKDPCCGGMEVNYYVEKKFEPYARLIFGNTPEMIEHFGKVLGVTYPWPKFSQVVVQDFVSGAMENTSAVVHFGGLQHDSREHLDETYEDIISHELFHQWFGDLVTCESWSNISLNESFATYGEYIWQEHKYGPQAADKHLLETQQAYFFESSYKQKPLIRFYYDNKEDVFDAHSYQKGGSILHMLRKTIGDEAFYAGLKLYLTRNAYTDVEIHELRLAFEDVTGQDLNWFFNQWIFKPGHPELSITYDLNSQPGFAKVSVSQDQESGITYRLPVKVDIVTAGIHNIQTVTMESRDTTFTFNVNVVPDYMVFDADQMLLARRNETKSYKEWLAQLLSSQNYIQKATAMNQLVDDLGKPEVFSAILASVKDPYSGNRLKAIESIGYYYGERRNQFYDACIERVMNDPDARVRSSALNSLEEYVSDFESLGENPSAIAMEQKQKFRTMLDIALNDSSYSVQSSALGLLYKFDSKAGFEAAKAHEKDKGTPIAGRIANIYIRENSPDALPFVGRMLTEGESGFGKYQFVNLLIEFIATQPKEIQDKGIELLQTFAASKEIWWIRSAAIRALGDYTDRESVMTYLKELLVKEKKEELQVIIRGILGE